jgi:hypothetical protein
MIETLTTMAVADPKAAIVMALRKSDRTKFWAAR